MTVVPFKSAQKPPVSPQEEASPRVWTCDCCGSQAFYLFENGGVQCYKCQNICDEVQGHWIIPSGRPLPTG
jgi:hypothetical protein